ncbi:Bug family tripartite tricarboxylate transporter substrate binding protein [Bradyrhizobium sp.]|jgi:tripartite-type tricarboxylate transporter receptor subunit TctC|uniref:Bug family tripartite tricarboxylate transporter substrate binding protein n=2 Tax=Bradyrhizobium sp. TaxID=376 RepID=UPI003C733ED8
MLQRVAVFALAAGGLFAFTAPGTAQQYPSRTVTIVCPYPAGGPTDQTARVIANFLSKKFNQNFIVENVTGAGTIIATNRVAKASPDGYTLLLHNLQISVNATLYKNMPFDTTKDLTGVILVNNNPLVLVGRKDLQPNTLPELLAFMKKERLKAALPGYGATGHLATTLVAQEAEVPIDQIPYRGAAPAMTDLMGGHVDLFFGTPQSVVPLVKSGELKAYGVTSKTKLEQLPNVESFVKVLGPKLEILYWQAMYAPAGTSEAVIKTLNVAMQEAVSDPTIIKTWDTEGFFIYPKEMRTPAAANALLKSEIVRWGQVIRDNNIHVDQ